MRRALLVAAGAGGALFLRSVYLQSVAFPRALRAAGERMQEDVRAIREVAELLDGLPLSPEDNAARLQSFVAGRLSRSPLAAVRRLEADRA